MCDPHDIMRLTAEAIWPAGLPGPAADRLRGLEWAFEAVDIGLVLLDAAGQTVFANAAARRIAGERDGLKITLSGLATADPASTRKLMQMICRLAFQDAAEPVRMRLERQAQARPLLLTLIRVPGAEMTDAVAFRAMVAVFIRDVGAPPRFDQAALAGALDLTRREGQIAELLGQGAGLQTISSALRIGLGTVRGHLKRIFHKTGTTSQLGLSTLVRGFAEPLDLDGLADGCSGGAPGQ